MTEAQELSDIVLPECPVFRMRSDGAIICERLEIHGLKSNYCPTCEKPDPDCAVYVDWYISKHPNVRYLK